MSEEDAIHDYITSRLLIAFGLTAEMVFPAQRAPQNTVPDKSNTETNDNN